MTGYSIDVVVVEIKADTQVSFGYRVPVPAPPLPPGVLMPKQIAYKHAIHLFIPKDKWVDQFGMWEEYHLIVSDDGAVELKKKA